MDDNSWPPIPFRRMLAILRYRGMDLKDISESHASVQEALAAHQLAVANSFDELFASHAKTLQQTMQQSLAEVPQPGVRDLMTSSLEIQMAGQKQAAEISMQHLEAATEVVWSAYSNYLALLQQTAEMLGAKPVPTGKGTKK